MASMHRPSSVIGHHRAAYGGADLAFRAVLGYVQRIDGARHHAVDFGLGVGLRLFVASQLISSVSALFCRLALKGPAKCRFRSTLLPFNSSQVGGLGPQAGALDKVTGTKPAVMAASVCADVCRRVVWRQIDACYGGGDLGVHLHGGVVLHQRCGNCGVHLCCGAVGQQCRRNGRVSLRGRFVRHQGGSYCRVCLCDAVRVAGQAQGEIVVLQAHAEGRVEVQVAQRVGAQEQVPGDLAGPGLGVDQVAAAAGGQGCRLREDGVYGALQAGFGSSQDVAKGPADCKARMSASWASSLPSLSASAASSPVCCT